MRRWNGWGDPRVTMAVPSSAATLLARLLGPGDRPTDATLADVVGAVPPSRLPSHRLVEQDPEVRVRHARGQSLPDWIALRSGRLVAIPDGVAFPSTASDVRELLRFARATGADVVPYGGGSSVGGGVDPRPGAETLTVSLARMSRLERFDAASGLATFGAGAAGPTVEASLGELGWTLGHYPQSWEGSTVGGWVATRSSGQQSLGFGRIEQLFAGGHLEAPAGPLDLPPHPASAAGPDLRQLVLGSEGRLGILTDVVVRATPRPELDVVLARFLPTWDVAVEAARDLSRARLPISMLRLSTPAETATTLAMAARRGGVRLVERYLSLRGLGRGRCLLLVGLTGRRLSVASAAVEMSMVLGGRGAVAVPGLGRSWKAERFRTPYLRESLWAMGYAVDTLETAAPWSAVEPIARGVATALRGGLAADGERVHAFSHLSHVYPTGSSLYTTYVFRLADDPDATLERWRRLKTAASDAIAAAGGTISQQHGIGTDHRRWLPAEKGELGMAALEAVARRFDPEGIMNPGKLLPAWRHDPEA
ncbi:MAG TPA: FAD-binding oxidoreductase [Candidatus Dormibacteraeota bacterium]|nr:FAD-binding oxidoreductase [Candidatus Dormibacteraeota bacterium]